jgi:NADH:ubiquinone oxidoreductase subunit 6 (subunit J)
MFHSLDAILGPAYFWLFASISVLCGLGLLLARHPINGAIYLIGVMLSLSGIYALLNSPFLAVLQVLVYAGAIMMLVVFVIMVLNQAKEHTIPVIDWFGLAGLVLPVVLGAALITTAASANAPTFRVEDKAGLLVSPLADQANSTVQFTAVDAGEGASYAWEFGDKVTSNGRSISHEFAQAGTYTATLTVSGAKEAAKNGQASVTFRAISVPRGEIALLSATMFNVSTKGPGYYLLFELVGVVLLAAVVGAVVLAKRSLDSAPPEQPPHQEGHH